MDNFTQITLDVYTIPRGFSDPVDQASRLGYYQISVYDISEDAIDDPLSKFETFDELTKTHKSDYVVVYLPTMGDYSVRRPIYVGIVDSADTTTVQGKRNVINCRPIASIMDFEFIVTPETTTQTDLNNAATSGRVGAEGQVEILCKEFLATYNRNTENINNSTWKYHIARGGNIKISATGRAQQTPYTYQPTANFNIVNMRTYMFGLFKKYAITTHVRSVNWNNTELVIGGSTQKAFPIIDIQVGTHDTYNISNINAIKDNTDDLFDWEFSTSVGSTVANACYIFDPEWKKNQAFRTTNVNVGGTTEKQLVPILGNQVRSTELAYDVTAKTGNYFDQDTQYTASVINTRLEKYTKRLFVLTTEGKVEDAGATADNNLVAVNGTVQEPIKSRMVLLDPTDSERPLIQSGANAGQPSRDFADLTRWYTKKAEALLSMATYAHQFKVKLRLNSKNFDWTKDLLIGKEIEVTYKGVKYASIVSARQLSDHKNYITIVLGHNRNKLAPALRDKID